MSRVLVLALALTLVIPVSYSYSSPGTAALQTLMKYPVLAQRIFGGGQSRGLARSWYEARVPEFGNITDPRDISGIIRGLESDQLAARVLESHRTQRMLRRLNLGAADDVFDEISRGFFDFGTHQQRFFFEPVNPRTLALRQGLESPVLDEAVANGSVFVVRRRGTTEHWVSVGEDGFYVIEGADQITAPGLIRFSTSKDFVANQSGLAALGNRFTVSRSDPDMIFSTGGNQIHLFRKREGGIGHARPTVRRAELDHEAPTYNHEGAVAVLDITGPSAREIVCMDHLERAGHHYMVAVVNSQGNFRFWKWKIKSTQLNGSNRHLISDMNPRVEENAVREVEDAGSIILGVRLLPETTQEGRVLFAIDLLTPHEGFLSRTLTFDFYRPPVPHSF